MGIYTPKTALSDEADGKFCCRSVPAGSSQFPGAVPKDWMRSMNYFGTKGTYIGDHYTGDIKIYWSNAAGLDFWYYETPDGKPVDQGEGCYFPSAKTNYKKHACQSMLPIVLWHEFDQFNATTYSKDDFTVPDICKNTNVQCTIPGVGPAPGPSPSPPSPVPPSPPAPPAPPAPAGSCAPCASLVKAT